MSTPTAKASNLVRIRLTYMLGEILVTGGNPNGDPDQNGYPRIDVFIRGVINGTAIKRQIRDHILDRSPTFLDLAKELGLDIKAFGIYVRPDASVVEFGKMEPERFRGENFDARVFGSTLLTKETDAEGNKGDKPKTAPCRGVIQIEDALSLAPVYLEDRNGTRKSGVTDDKTQGMRERKVVVHGLYRFVVVITDSRGNASGATAEDIVVFKRLLADLYSQNSEASRGTRLESLYEFVPSKSVSLSTFERNVGLKLKEGVTTPSSIDDYELRDASVLETLGNLTKLV